MPRSGKLITATLTNSGQITTAGKASKLIVINFCGTTAGDLVAITNGSGGTTIFTLKTGAYGNSYLGPFTEENAPVFTADIYAAVSMTASCVINAVAIELANE